MVLTSTQLALVREKLESSSKATKEFICPLLGVDVAHDVLFNFARDTSRTFEEWIWDPPNRAVLMRLRDHLDSVQGTHLSTTYNQVLNEDNDASMDCLTLLEQVQPMRLSAKTQFQQGNWYAALNHYKRCVELLQPHMENDQVLDSENEEIQDLYWSSCTNVAVVGIKQKQPVVVREYVDRVLEYPNETKYHKKALYCKSKSYLLEHRYEEAREVLAQYVDESKDLQSLWNMIERTETQLKARQPAKPLTIKDSKKEKTKDKFRMVPLPRRGLTNLDLRVQFHVWWEKSRSQLV